MLSFGETKAWERRAEAAGSVAVLSRMVWKAPEEVAFELRTWKTRGSEPREYRGDGHPRGANSRCGRLQAVSMSCLSQEQQAGHRGHPLEDLRQRSGPTPGGARPRMVPHTS